MFVRFIGVLFLLGGLIASPSATALQALANAAPPILPADYQPWPKEVKSGAITYLVYEPQAESWTGTEVRFRAAVAVTVDGGTRYGVVFGRARTWADAETGLVKLENISLDRGNFPTAPDGGEAYLRELQRGVTGTWLVRREQLGPDHAARQAVSVRNDPPRIYISYSPALLVLIDGSPVLRKVPNSRFERVINTRSLLLKDPGSGRFYLHAFDGWLMAREVQGPWQILSGEVSGLDQAKEQISAAGQVDLLDGGEERPSLRSGAPVIYVSTIPAELIVLKGEPQFEPITGTHLLWAKNTTAPLLLDTGSNDYYAVISGRWFRARSLNGPWNFAPADKLPVDLALIPDDHALAPVRAAVPGTPQAQEAVIANSVPQTATVSRMERRFQPTLDGEPQLRPIEGTQLQHVANSPTPIIRVDDRSWFAVDQGVWYRAPALEGPWEVATSVPPAIYGIPSTSPLHYVTYVQVYGATPDVVYTGYTPGYLGSVVAPAGTVVYGSGFYASPWVGSVWYGAPWTYGFGWSVGIGTFWPQWNPWGPPWWGAGWGGWWRPSYWGWGGGWGPRPGWGWVRPPVYYPPMGRLPGVFPPGGLPPPGFHPPGFRPPGGFPPPGVRPPIAPPVAGPNVPRSPGPGFLDSTPRYRYGTQPAPNAWAQSPANRGPGWSTVGTPAVPGAGAPALPNLPQGFQRSAQGNPSVYTVGPSAGGQAALPAPAPGIASPGVPNANLFNGSSRGTPGVPQTFRSPGAPNVNPYPGGAYRGTAPGVVPPVTGAPPATTLRAGPMYAPAAASPGLPPAYRANPAMPPSPPSNSAWGRAPVTPGGVAPGQTSFPAYSPGAGAAPRFNGGVAPPSAPVMMPRSVGSSPGFGGPAIGYGGVMAPSSPAMLPRGGGGMPGYGVPAGGFRGAPGAPSGPGWGGRR